MKAIIHFCYRDDYDGDFEKTIHVEALPDVDDLVRVIPPDGGAPLNGYVERREFSEELSDDERCKEDGCTTLVAHIYVDRA